MNIGDIFRSDENYSKYSNYANENGLVVVEIEPDENGRRFQLQEIPPLSEEERLNELRMKREIECFSVINRGKLWYDTLTEQQLKELQVWYQAWLDVTKTMVEPEKPTWIK